MVKTAADIQSEEEASGKKTKNVTKDEPTLTTDDTPNTASHGDLDKPIRPAADGAPPRASKDAVIEQPGVNGTSPKASKSPTKDQPAQGELLGHEHSGAAVYAAPGAVDDPNSPYTPRLGDNEDQSVNDPADGSEAITPLPIKDHPVESIFKVVKELNETLYDKTVAKKKDYWYALQVLRMQAKTLHMQWVQMRDKNRAKSAPESTAAKSSSKSAA